MRCSCCDVLLSEREITKKHPVTGEYFDMCTDCYIEYRNAAAELAPEVENVEYVPDYLE